MVRSQPKISRLLTTLRKQGEMFSFASNIQVTDKRIQRALDLIQSLHAVQIADVASKLNLSPSRFRHLFKQDVGFSPGHYVRQLRLKHAKRLLEHTFLSVKEIAAQVGANDVSHFVRDYKTLYGHTPSEARRGRARRLPTCAFANKQQF